MEYLKDSNPENVMTTLAEAACSTDPEVEAHRAELDGARAAWGKKYGMADEDWADVLDYDKDSGHNFFHGDINGNSFATMTPVDQFKAILKGFDKVDSDPMYMADAFESHLSETGRLAFLLYCVDKNIYGDDYDVVKWAVCQPDIDKFDPQKVFQELHADPHDGSSKFYIRFRAISIKKELDDIADRKAKLIKKDDEYGRIFKVAGKGYGDWATAIGTNTKVLELVEQMDSATYFHSRKQFEGCEPKVQDALAAAVSKIPAKAFAGMHDVKDGGGFGRAAAAVLALDPGVELAALAYSGCQPDGGIGDFMKGVLSGTPSVRGPRDYALTAVMRETFKFDDTTKGKMQYPDFTKRRYFAYPDLGGTFGGVVKSVKVQKDSVVVAVAKTAHTQQDCMKEHQGRAVRIRQNGSIEYEMICDKWATVSHDDTYPDFKLNPGAEKWLKPGVVFSTYRGDVIGVWPSASAKLPSMVVGGRVK